MPYDGKSHYCAKCGKAGFKSDMAVRGHLSSCQGADVILQEFAQAAAAAPPPPPPAPPEQDTFVDNQTRTNHDSTKELKEDIRYLRMQLAKRDKQLSKAVQIGTNHLAHLAGDHVHNFVPHPSMVNDPLNLGFGGIREAFGLSPQQWAIIKAMGFLCAGYLIWHIVSQDSQLKKLALVRVLKKLF